VFILAPKITPEGDNLPIHSSQSVKKNWFWMSVGVEGKGSNWAGYVGLSQDMS